MHKLSFSFLKYLKLQSLINISKKKVFSNLRLFNCFLLGTTSTVSCLLLLNKINKNYFINSKLFLTANANSKVDRIKTLNYIADVVETVSPSVVTVSSGVLMISVGSGFIVDDTGYILTNAHVVARNAAVSIKLASGERFIGEVIAIDKSSDLALIKIEPDKHGPPLQALKLGDVEKVRAGEFVIALGSPMTLANSVTVGVISALDRDLGHPRGLRYLQTDAIITVGNSGGPLVNLNGDVVGVNTMMASTGFGFAVPSNHARRFYEMAVAGRRRGSGPTNPLLFGGYGDIGNSSKPSSVTGNSQKYLGVVMGSLTPQMAIEMALTHPEYAVRPQTGVVIHSVFHTSPASRSGLLPGDIVESVNGQPVHNTAELSSLLKEHDSLDISVVREGQRRLFKSVTPETD